jgi:hypothetical protein
MHYTTIVGNKESTAKKQPAATRSIPPEITNGGTHQPSAQWIDIKLFVYYNTFYANRCED